MLDRIDYKILAILQADARISNKDLAAQADIAPSTCLERVRRLQRSGAIRGYHADVDPRVLGIGLQAVVAIRLVQQGQLSFSQLGEELLQMQEVVLVYFLTGTEDVLVHLAVQDVTHLRDVLQTLAEREDLSHLQTSLVFEVGQAGPLPNYLDTPATSQRSELPRLKP